MPRVSILERNWATAKDESTTKISEGERDLKNGTTKHFLFLFTLYLTIRKEKSRTILTVDKSLSNAIRIADDLYLAGEIPPVHKSRTGYAAIHCSDYMVDKSLPDATWICQRLYLAGGDTTGSQLSNWFVAIHHSVSQMAISTATLSSLRNWWFLTLPSLERCMEQIKAETKASLPFFLLNLTIHQALVDLPAADSPKAGHSSLG